MIRKALFSGSFDPFTIGHYSIVQRGLQIFDEIIIAIGINSKKKTLFPLADRINTLKDLYSGEKRILITSYNCLTIDFALQSGSNFILRGLRNTLDFEYEKNMASIHRQLTGIETVFLLSDPEYASISSTLVRDFILHKKDISTFIPIKK